MTSDCFDFMLLQPLLFCDIGSEFDIKEHLP